MGHRQGHEPYKFYAGLVEEVLDHARTELQRAFGQTNVAFRRLPPKLRRVWRLFWDLNEAREIKRDVTPETDERGTFAWRSRSRIDRLSHGEVRAWLELNRLMLEPWEMAALTLLDESYVNAFNAAASGQPQPIVSERPMSSSLFRALFAGKK